VAGGRARDRRDLHGRGVAYRDTGTTHRKSLVCAGAVVMRVRNDDRRRIAFRTRRTAVAVALGHPGMTQGAGRIPRRARGVTLEKDACRPRGDACRNASAPILAATGLQQLAEGVDSGIDASACGRTRRIAIGRGLRREEPDDVWLDIPACRGSICLGQVDARTIHVETQGHAAGALVRLASAVITRKEVAPSGWGGTDALCSGKRDVG
jgi:hypothetical protein